MNNSKEEREELKKEIEELQQYLNNKEENLRLLKEKEFEALPKTWEEYCAIKGLNPEDNLVNGEIDKAIKRKLETTARLCAVAKYYNDVDEEVFGASNNQYIYGILNTGEKTYDLEKALILFHSGKFADKFVKNFFKK